MCCYKNYQHKSNEKLKKRFFNTYKFANHGNCKFVLLLQKGVYPYEYMHDWEQLNETLLPEKKKKKKVFTVTQTWKILLKQITRKQKEFVRTL